MVDRYRSLQRVCNKCYSAVTAASYDDSPPNSPRSPTSPRAPMSPRTSQSVSDSQQQLIKKLQSTSLLIATNFPSYDICYWLTVDIKKREIIVRLPTEQHWDMTIGMLSEIGNIISNSCLHINQIRKPMAEAVCISQSLNKDWINRPGASEIHHTEAAVDSAGSTWHPDIICSSVNKVYQETNALYLLSKDQGSIQYGRFVGTFCLNTQGNDDLKASLLTTCLTQLYSNNDKQNPIYIIGRCGRIDTAVKCKDLVLMITEVIRKMRNRYEETVEYRPMRIRICSLLNAISIDKKESQFFRAQCSTLTGNESPKESLSLKSRSMRMRSSQRPSPPVSPSEQLTEDLVAQYRDHLNVNTSGSSISSFHSDLSTSSANNTDRDGTAHLDFEAHMQSLNADYSYINLVANWPLSLRLGASQNPQHNVCSRFGYMKHLKWLEHDVRDALFQRRLEYVGCFDYDYEDDTVWKISLPRLRDAVQTLIRTSTTDDQREESCKYFMAVVLLSELVQSKGSNFRGRAAELLQLCLLEHILEVIPFFNCKSGIDRTGVATALWTSVHQLLLGENALPLWQLYYLSLSYPIVLKLCYGIHGCGDLENKMRQIPMRQLHKCCFAVPETQLPFAAGGSGDSEVLAKYSVVEELYQILHPGAESHSHSALGSVPQRAFELINSLFLIPSDGIDNAIIPRLQHAFFLNIVGTTTKVAAFSTGVFGLKYGDCGMVINQYNALAAQFLPSKICSPSRTLNITETRRGLTGTDVVVSKEFAPYLVAASDARGT